MSTRFGFRSFRDQFTKYRLKTRQKRIKLVNYFRQERQRIIERQRQKLFKRIIFWSAFAGTSYLIYNEIYRKNLQIMKMNKKLDNIYTPIMEKQVLKDELVSIMLKPTTLDQLTNIISLAYRYHFKIIVRMGDLSKRQKIIMAQQFDTKCIFVNLSALKNAEVNQKNNTVYVQTGACCLDINRELEEKGYQALFPKELEKEKVYDVIVNNLPLNEGELNRNTVCLEMISSSGQNFRSAGETNRYGQIPSLNPLFIGTGGIFALPSAITLNIRPKAMKRRQEEHLKVDINNDSLKIDALRKLNKLNSQFVEVELANNFNGQQETGALFMTCKEQYPVLKEPMDQCASLAQAQNVPVIKLEKTSEDKQIYNMFFSVNNSIFEEFLLSYGREVRYAYKNGLLKIFVQGAEENQEKMVSIISEITSHNGVLVWCSSQQLLMRIKPSLDSSEVGAELMRKIVQVREGLDRRNIFYSHSRYQQYFAKGLLRRMTEVFW